MTVVYDHYAGNSYLITFHLTVNSGKKSYEARENSTNNLQVLQLSNFINFIKPKELFCLDEMVVAPKDGRTDCPRIDVTMDDHPLSINPDSKWQTFFKDNEVLLQIDKDVR